MHRNAAPDTCANCCAANMAKPPKPRIPMPTAFDDMRYPAPGSRTVSPVLGRRAPDVLRPRTLRPFTKVEFHAVALLQILKAFAIHGAAVEKVLLPRIVLDEPEPLFNSQRLNRSRHRVLPLCSVSTFGKPDRTHGGDRYRRVRTDRLAVPFSTSSVCGCDSRNSSNRGGKSLRGSIP